MPQAYVKKMATKHGISVDAAERKWNRAKKAAAEQGHEEEYDYITGIFKKMMGESDNGLNEVVTHAVAFKSITDDMKPGERKYVGRHHGKEVVAKKDLKGTLSFFHRDGIRGQLKKVSEEKNLEEGKMSEVAQMIEDEFEKFARRHGDEYTATHMGQVKNHIAGKVSKEFGIEKTNALKLVNDALTEHVAPKTTFKEYLFELSKGKNK